MPRSSSSPAAAAAARRMLLVCFFSRLVTVQWLGGGTAAAAWVLVRRSSLLPPPRSSGGGPGARPTTAQFQQSSSSSDGLTAPISLKTTIPTADPQSQHAQVLLTSHQIDFVRGYLNKHHSDLLLAFAAAFSSLGSEMAIANVWSGGSFSLVSARLTDIAASLEEDDTTSNNNNNDTAKPNVSQLSLILAVTVHRRGKTPEERTVAIPLTANPIPERLRSYDAALVALVVPTTTAATVDDADSTTATTTTKTRSYVPQPIDTVVRHLCRLCAIVNQPDVAGKLIQLAIQLEGSGIGKLPENMYLNQVPHNRYVRQYFYDKASAAILDSVILASQRALTNRQKVVTMFPETNPSMDSYRIGTLLELVRTVAIRLVTEGNVRVRICVQKSMGVGIFTGVPKQLSGVAQLLQAMDWQSGPGEENEGMVGEYVRFGAIGPDHVYNQVCDDNGVVTQYADDVFLVLAPQSMVGTDTSIIPLLSTMVDAAGDRPVILFNPDLTDKISAAGQQSVRGRQARIDFANSFQTVFHFQNIYVSGTSYFPILGSITKMHPQEPWVAHQRRDFTNDEGELYVPVLAGEMMPTGESILQSFAR